MSVPALRISRPYANLQYLVEMKGVTEGIFNEVSGLEVQIEVFEYKEGGYNTHVHRLPGHAKVSNITLKRGIAPLSHSSGVWASELWKWYCDVLKGQFIRQHLSIILIDSTDGKQVFRWNVIDAFPVKWTGPALKSGESTVAVEAIELAHRGVQLA